MKYYARKARSTLCGAPAAVCLDGMGLFATSRLVLADEDEGGVQCDDALLRDRIHAVCLSVCLLLWRLC